jgi:hypothetical protein
MVFPHGDVSILAESSKGPKSTCTGYDNAVESKLCNSLLDEYSRLECSGQLLLTAALIHHFGYRDRAGLPASHCSVEWSKLSAIAHQFVTSYADSSIVLRKDADGPCKWLIFLVVVLRRLIQSALRGLKDCGQTPALQGCSQPSGHVRPSEFALVVDDIDYFDCMAQCLQCIKKQEQISQPFGTI